MRTVRWRRASWVRLVAVVTSLAVVLAGVSWSGEVTRPDGAGRSPRGSLPVQGTGTAPRGGHQVGATATETDLKSPPRDPARPAGAVPDTRAVPAVGGTAPAGRVTVRNPEVTPDPAAHGYDPATSREVVGQRTATTQTFQNADGTDTLRVFDGPANVRRPDGTWVPVDLSLTSAPGGLAPRAAPHAVTLDGPSTRVAVDADHSVAFGLAGAASVAPTVSGDTATYHGIRPGTDLRLSATRSGVKEDLVLSAPVDGFDYTLTATGLTPVLRADGSIALRDKGNVTRAVIPAGSMTDARGAGSAGVRYALTSAGTLRVTLDRAWLTDPARAYPVTVDPSVRVLGDGDDTYVRSGVGDASGALDLDVGRLAGSSGLSRSYLHFLNVHSGLLVNQYVVGAALVADLVDAASCTGTPITAYRVASAWSGGDLRWPGAGVNKAYQTSSIGCDLGWKSFALDANDVTAWTHGGAFNGLSLRAADESDGSSFKRFASADSANPPYLDVTYASEGASYSVNELILPTANQAGSLTVTVTNQGQSTWRKGTGFGLGYTIFKGGTAVYTMNPVAAPQDVPPMGSATWTLSIPARTPDTYSLRMTMFNASSQDFHAAYGVPYGVMPMIVHNVQPSVNYEQPGTGATVGSITPTLYAEGVDMDNWPGGPLKFDFKICGGTADAPTGCVESGWTGHTWMPPDGTLKWSQTYNWWVRAHDGAEAGPFAGPIVLDTEVPQPEITGHLAGNPDTIAGPDPDSGPGAVGPGLDPQIGNYSTQATDTSVATVGPDLTITRTYNSLDPRTTDAFGVGWSSRVDTRLADDADGSGNVVATLPTGREVRFGQNHDETYAAPAGDNLTLVYDSSTGQWTLRDPTGTRYVFDIRKRLSTVVDPDGLTETLAYDSAGRVHTITNQTSHRSLTLDWTADTGGHVRAVTASNGPQWTYTYDGDRLTAVCAPRQAPNCTHYTYGSGSHYRSAVLDDNPRAYYRLDETSGTAPAASVTARTPGADAGAYHGVVLGVSGPTGMGGTAAEFDGANGFITLPDKLVSPSMSGSVELWFKTSGGSGGVLVSYQSGGQFPDQSGGLWTPLLYVGTDGYLYGGFWVPQPTGPRQAVSQVPVNDDQWHHVVLTAAINTQTLYLDGQAQDGIQGVIDHQEQIHLAVGAGRTQGWPATNGNAYYFRGDVDELAVYLHPLGALAVAEHYAAVRPVAELTRATLPQDDRLFAAVDYNASADRVATLTDHDGRQWTLDPPSVNGSTRTVVLHGPYPDWTYTYDVDHAGRPLTVTHNNGTRRYDYNTAGFVKAVTDENNHQTSYTTDTRGNVLSLTTCRAAGSCDTSYYTYFLNAADPLDPRNDQLLTSADARSSGPTDTTYQVTYQYDAAGRLVYTGYPASSGVPASHATVAYTTGTDGAGPAGLPLKVTGRRGQVTTYAYDPAGDLTQAVSATGLHLDYAYDALGRPVTVKLADSGDVGFGTTAYKYTDLSQVDTVTGPAVTNPLTGVTHQLVTGYAYDGDGNVLSTTQSDATGGDPARTTSYGYDAHDRLTSAAYPAGGGTWRVGYDDAGRKVTTTDPNGIQWTDQTDDLGRLLVRTAQGPGVDPMDPTQTSLVLEYRSWDPAGRLSSVTDAMNRLTRYTYYDDDQLAKVTSAGSRDIDLHQYVYDPAGNLTQDTAAGGAVATYAYDATGYLTRQTLDPNGLNRSTAYLRDADGNPTRVSRTGAADPTRTEQSNLSYRPDGQLLQQDDLLSAGVYVSTSYGYDERGLKTSMTDPRRNQTTYQYDANGALTTTQGPATDTWVAGVHTSNVRPTETLGYDAFGDQTQRRDPNGAVTTTGYDGMGRPVAMTLPDYTPPGGTTIHAATTRIGYDPVGDVQTVTDALNRTTRNTYDPYGNLTQRQDPGGGLTITGYDRDGETLSVTDPTGAQTRYTYDELGRRVTRTAVERVPAPTTYLTTTTRYDDAGDPAQVTTPGGNTTVTSYDPAGEPISVTDPTQRQTRYGYDIAGRPASTVDPSGLTTSTGYDLLGRAVTSAQSKDGTTLRTASRGYDADGNLTDTTSAAGRRAHFDYDPLGQLFTQTAWPDPNTTIKTTLGYDADGNQTRVVDGDGHATDYTYTPWGLPESTVDPATAGTPDPVQRTWTTRYDAAGQPTSDQIPGGVTHAYTYDALGRLTKETGSGAEAATSDRVLGYDAAGRVTSVGTPSGSSTYGYDDRGDLVRSAAATYTYTADGQTASRTDAAGTATFGYDGAGRPQTMVDPVTGRTVNYTYNPAGRLGVVSDPATTTTRRTLSYDNLGRLSADQLTQTVDTGVPPRVLLGTGYGYDADDNVTDETTTVRDVSTDNAYGYDGAGRLTSWTAGGQTTAYGWDAAGNRTRAGNTTYTYNERNQLTSDGSDSYAYTPRGTLSSVGGQQVAYDAFDRMVSDGGTSYAYDGLDRLASRNGTAFGYDDLTGDVVTDGTRVTSWTPDGTPFADRAATGTTGRMLYANQHGDVTGRYLSSSVLDSRAYDPFGTVTSSTGEQPSVGYQSGWTDPATGQVDMAARWYDPAAGTFDSRDSVGPGTSVAAAANRYGYADGNPVTATDPSGHCPFCVDLLFDLFWELTHPERAGAAGCEMRDDGSCSGYHGPCAAMIAPNCTESLTRYGSSTPTGNPPTGTGNGDGSGDDGNGPSHWLPPWWPNVIIPLPLLPPGFFAPPRPVQVPVDGPNTKVIDRGPQETRDATKVTKDLDSGNDPGIGGPGGGIVPFLVTVAALDHLTRAVTKPRPDDDDCQPQKRYGTMKNGRATGAYAIYCDGRDVSGGRRPNPLIRPAGYGNGYRNGKQLARCHLLARRLGGTGSDEENFVACYQQRLNGGTMKSAEGTVASHVARQHDVLYVVTPIYCQWNKADMPNGIYLQAVDWTEGDNYFMHRVFYNQFNGNYRDVRTLAGARKAVCSKGP